MQLRLLRLRFRRRLRKGQQQVEGLGVQAEEQIEEHLFKRFNRLVAVRRFVATWVTLVVLLMGLVIFQNISLSGQYQTVQTVPGGIYNEGVRGRFTNANPLFATSDADVTVSHLVFAGLFKNGADGKLSGDLASGYTVDAQGTSYTVKLRPNLTWHDGQPLTSADVVYTYHAIQNPDAQSPLASAWQGVTVTAPDARTVIFKLPSILASFPYSMTNGIVPKHLLSTVPMNELRSADFNTIKPVGAGPFAWQAVEVGGDGTPQKATQQIALTPFEKYHAGKPKLQKFVVKVFADQEELIAAFDDRQLTAVEGLTEVPAELRDDRKVVQRNLPLRAATMVFFKTSEGILSEQPVRRALVQGADSASIIKKLGYPARQVREPFLLGQLGYDHSLTQPQFDLKAAKEQLDAAGWKVGEKGIRHKDKRPLSFTLTTNDTGEAKIVSAALRTQWQALGVDLKVQPLDPTDFQSTLNYHSYDAVLNGISIGIDPDVFVYWDSSQADIRSARLNLSEYKNEAADAALEAGRTRLDPSLRVIKYKPFLQAWQQDNPALGLYQPRLLYMTNGLVNGLEDRAISVATDRFNNVHNWEIREAKVTNP